MPRTPEEVFGHHAEALTKADIDQIVADYSDDAVFVTPSGVRTGKAGVRAGFEELLALVPNATWDVPTAVFAGDLLLIEWSARSAANDVTDGVDTFVFKDGMIRAQTVRYTVRPH
jgi:ketosteroid isomerase-like protein